MEHHGNTSEMLYFLAIFLYGIFSIMENCHVRYLVFHQLQLSIEQYEAVSMLRLIVRPAFVLS